VAVAIGHLAFIVSQVALFALPSGIALALAVNVLASLTAQHGAYAIAAIVTAKPRVTLTVT